MVRVRSAQARGRVRREDSRVRKMRSAELMEFLQGVIRVRGVLLGRLIEAIGETRWMIVRLESLQLKLSSVFLYIACSIFKLGSARSFYYYDARKKDWYVIHDEIQASVRDVHFGEISYSEIIWFLRCTLLLKKLRTLLFLIFNIYRELSCIHILYNRIQYVII